MVTATLSGIEALPQVPTRPPEAVTAGTFLASRGVTTSRDWQRAFGKYLAQRYTEAQGRRPMKAVAVDAFFSVNTYEASDLPLLERAFADFSTLPEATMKPDVTALELSVLVDIAAGRDPYPATGSSRISRTICRLQRKGLVDWTCSGHPECKMHWTISAAGREFVPATVRFDTNTRTP